MYLRGADFERSFASVVADSVLFLSVGHLRVVLDLSLARTVIVYLVEDIVFLLRGIVVKRAVARKLFDFGVHRRYRLVG